MTNVNHPAQDLVNTMCSVTACDGCYLSPGLFFSKLKYYYVPVFAPYSGDGAVNQTQKIPVNEAYSLVRPHCHSFLELMTFWYHVICNGTGDHSSFVNSENLRYDRHAAPLSAYFQFPNNGSNRWQFSNDITNLNLLLQIGH